MAGRLRWGLLGASSAVARLAVGPALAASASSEVVAVASLSRAAGSYEAFGAKRAHAAYQALIEDPGVEAVYVPLPNSLHERWVLAAARAGRHVLCEKPLATSQASASRMAEACTEAGVFLMEAYMTPFHPRAAALAALVSAGRLGELRFARAAFTGILSRPDDHRWRRDMGGGSLADVGIYCVAPILSAGGGRLPRAVAAAARSTAGGVDSSLSGWLDMGAGFGAAIECSFEVPERQHLELVGTEASARVERAFTPGPADSAIWLAGPGGRAECLQVAGADPYLGMVEHFAAVVAGRQAPARPPAESVRLAGVLDQLAAAAGLRFGG